MSTLIELLAEHTTLAPEDVEHLQRLVGEWQLLSDLSFADLLLWVPVTGGEFLCVAQVRPTTGPTAYQDDQVGRRQAGAAAEPQMVATGEGRIFREADPEWDGPVPVRREGIPVRREPGGRVLGVVGRDTNLVAPRSPSTLGAGLPAGRERPVPDGHRRLVPDRRPARRGARRPAGRGRADPAGRRRPGRVRQPERAVRVPAARA